MNWIRKFLEPKDMQFQEADLDDYKAALSNAQVRDVWFSKMIEKIKDINMELDNLLAKEEKDRIWETFAIERRTMLRMVQMILDAKQDIENGKVQEERENRLF